MKESKKFRADGGGDVSQSNKKNPLLEGVRRLRNDWTKICELYNIYII